jgi:hypothetical protein
MATEKMIELRFDVPASLATKIDALLMVDKHKSRADYLLPVLERAVEAEFHRATLLLRCAQINPLATAADGKGGA